MEYVHLVVHHRVNGLLHHVHWDVVPGGVHHQPPELEKRAILNRYRKSREMTFIVFCGTVQGLEESLKASHESHIMLS